LAQAILAQAILPQGCLQPSEKSFWAEALIAGSSQ